MTSRNSSRVLTIHSTSLKNRYVKKDGKPRAGKEAKMAKAARANMVSTVPAKAGDAKAPGATVPQQASPHGESVL
jgi:hypothetical protein